MSEPQPPSGDNEDIWYTQDSGMQDGDDIPVLQEVVDTDETPPPELGFDQSGAIPVITSTVAPTFATEPFCEQVTDRVLDTVQHTLDQALPDLLRTMEGQIKDSVLSHIALVLPDIVRDAIASELQKSK